MDSRFIINRVNEIISEALKEMEEKVSFVIPKIYANTEFSSLEYFVDNYRIIRNDILEMPISKDWYHIDDLSAFFEHLSIQAKLNNYSKKEIIEEYLLDYQKIVLKIVIIHVLYNLYIMSNFEDNKISNINGIDNNSHTSNSNNENIYWYRGQRIYSWKLMPSYYRSLGKKSQAINFKYLEKDYEDLKIDERIKSVFEDKKLDYEKISYIQHSMAITPLLDFTTDFRCAESFAVSDYSNPRDIFEESASVFRLKVNRNQIITDQADATRKLKELNVFYIGSKPYISTLIKHPFWVDLLTGKNSSSYELIDIKTNDRMRMQKGTFILFNNVMYIGETMIASLPKSRMLSSVITKVKIDKKDRYIYYKKIMDGDTRYQSTNLLNPYSYMIK